MAVIIEARPSSKSIIFSGIQPTGKLHLGNFLGAIKPWREEIQKNSQNTFLFSIVDMHAITVFQSPTELRNSVLETFAVYLASGIQPSENVHIFQQSFVPAHAELNWIISTNTPMGWLDRMTQYKDKTKENKERENLGLYAYPCLMAADILLYKTDLVPVGEDQKQHLEFTRDIAERINRLYKTEVFKIPEIKISRAKRIMSLKEGSRKMSKSDESDNSRINITDENDIIAGKIAKATTGNINSPEVKNLLEIYREATGIEYKHDGEIKFGAFKKDLTESLVSILSPIREEYKKLLNEKGELKKTLLNSSQKVKEIAEKNIGEIKNKIGF